jgi:membrane fusion protein (multidrug efflux system)
MRLAKTCWWLAASALLLPGGCGSGGPPAQPPAPAVGVVTLVPESVELTTDLPGRVNAFETSDVRPQVNGIIARRLFAEGATVARGQILYQIDDAPYRAALDTSQGQRARAVAAIAAAEHQARRYGDLVKMNAVSLQDADNAIASAGQARADVAAQDAAVHAARINLDYTQVRAPISGRIGRSLFTTGALVQNGQAQPLATIQRIDPVYVDIVQPASALLALRAEMAGGRVDGSGPASAAVRLTMPDGADYPDRGKLQFADVTVNQDTGSVVLRSIFPNSHGLLLPGMFIRARIIEGTMRGAIMVPAAGIGRDEAGRATALVVDGKNRVSLRRVVAARLIGGRWLVTAGLAAGDRVVVQGVDRVTPGMIVQPRAVEPIGPVPDGAAKSAPAA